MNRTVNSSTRWNWNLVSHQQMMMVKKKKNLVKYKRNHFNVRPSSSSLNVQKQGVLAFNFKTFFSLVENARKSLLIVSQNDLIRQNSGASESHDGIMKNLQGTLKKVWYKNSSDDEQKELDEINSNKIKTGQQMSAYVSNMMRDYFSPDNLWRIVSRDDTKKSDVQKPRFVTLRDKIKDRNVLVSKVAVDSSTRYCVDQIKLCQTSESRKFRVEELNRHLQNFPHAKGYALKIGAKPIILGIKAQAEKNGSDLKFVCSETLARLGHLPALKNSKGIRILAIDGGGMKGIIALEILRRIEASTGKMMHELFDYMIGVSTGSIIVSLLALKRQSVSEVDEIYREIGAQVFKQSYYGAVKGMVTSHAYYDTQKYESILRQFAGEDTMGSTAQIENCPKVAIVSAMMSSSRHSVSPYVFRNYTMPPRVTSNYRGSSRYKIWEAVRASSAAPGFFDDYHRLGKIFQDGGMISNNPTHIGIHEAKKLWPNEKLQCVVSIGLGRYEPLLVNAYDDTINPESGGPKNLTLKDKFNKLVLSATDTETVHNTLHDLLPDDLYFRFNPYLSEVISMDDTRLEKMAVLQNDTEMYCRRNRRRLELVSGLTTERPTYLHLVKRAWKQKLDSLEAVTAANLPPQGAAAVAS